MNLDLIKFYLDLFRISYKEYFSTEEIVVVLQGNHPFTIAARGQRIRGFAISFYYEPLIYFDSISDLLTIISMLFQRQIHSSGSVFAEIGEIIHQMKQIQELLLKV